VALFFRDHNRSELVCQVQSDFADFAPGFAWLLGEFHRDRAVKAMAMQELLAAAQ
jgi:hypothetical protein